MFVSGCERLPSNFRQPQLLTTPVLPVLHGTSVSLKCEPGILVGPIRSVSCNDGTFLTEGAGVPVCKGMERLGVGLVQFKSWV